MKYALCLHGMAFGTTDIGNKVDWTGAFPYFQKNVLGPDVDVYLHTWGTSATEWAKLTEAYAPVCSAFEGQKDFPGSPETRSIYSRWYSALTSIADALDPKTARAQYDGILLARYDLVFKVPFPWEQLDTKSFWTSKWRQKPAPDSGYLDYWFYGSRLDMTRLISLFFNLNGMFEEWGVKENGHSVVGEQIKYMQSLGTDVQQWGEQPEDFQLLRRMLGATN